MHLWQFRNVFPKDPERTPLKSNQQEKEDLCLSVSVERRNCNFHDGQWADTADLIAFTLTNLIGFFTSLTLLSPAHPLPTQSFSSKYLVTLMGVRRELSSIP